MKIVGYHTVLNKSGQCIVADSDGDLCMAPPYLDFLMRDKGECIKIFYHLNMAVACLCKAFGFSEYQCKKLSGLEEDEENKRKKSQLYFQGWTFKYRSNKFFSVRWGKFGNFVNFSDASQYADWKLEPYSSDKDVIARAKDAQRVCQEVYDALISLGLHPASLVSPIRAYEKEVLSKIDLPTHDDIPQGASEYAYICCRGGWTEAFQKGNYEESWDYDLKSAYPSKVAKLLDLRDGYFKYSKTYIPEAIYGYCRGKITVSGSFNPLLYNPNDEEVYPELKLKRDISERLHERNDPIYTPTGTYPTLRQKQVMEFVTKYKMATFDFADGWFWIPKKLTTPLKSEIERLHTAKEQASGTARDTIKRVLEGIYGKLLFVKQDDDEDPMGDNFNAVWASEVETPIQLEVARFVIDNGLVNNLLHIATDGVLSSKPAPVPENPAMGNWTLSSHGPAMVISSGIAAVRGKEATGEFSLAYDWLLDQIKQNPDASEYSLTKWSPVSLGVAMLQNKFDRLGQLETLTKTVRIPYELKRSYKEKPRTGGELLARHYVSAPRDISQVAGMKGLIKNNVDKI